MPPRRRDVRPLAERSGRAQKRDLNPDDYLDAILNSVNSAFRSYAQQAGVPEDQVNAIASKMKAAIRSEVLRVRPA